MKLYTEIYLLLVVFITAVDFLLYKQSKNRALVNKIFCFLPSLLFLAGFTWVKLFYKLYSDPQLPLIIMWFNLLFLTIYVPKFIVLIAGFVQLKARIERRKMQIYKALFVFAFFIFLIVGVFITPNRIDVRSVAISFEDLPAGFHDYTIVQFSDVHLGSRPRDKRFYKNIVAEINRQKPDLVVFTGDMVNNFASEMAGFDSVFLQIKSKDGNFAVSGNHDYGDYTTWATPKVKQQNLTEIKKTFTGLGFRLLNNESVYIKHGKDSIALLGVENFSTKEYRNYADLKKALNRVDKKSFKLLLSHNPEHWEHEILPQTDIDLTLSGHTHAAQMGMEVNGKVYSPAVFLYRQYNGIYKQKNQAIYVSRGVGYIGLPLLVGLSPEITVIKLKKQRN